MSWKWLESSTPGNKVLVGYILSDTCNEELIWEKEDKLSMFLGIINPAINRIICMNLLKLKLYDYILPSDLL
jgi:hypothetical protein